MANSELIFLYKNIGKSLHAIEPREIQEKDYILTINNGNNPYGQFSTRFDDQLNISTNILQKLISSTKRVKINFWIYNFGRVIIFKTESRSMRRIEELVKILEKYLDIKLRKLWINNILDDLVREFGGDILWAEFSTLEDMDRIYNPSQEEFLEKLKEYSIRELEIIKKNTRIYTHISGIFEINPKNENVRKSIIENIRKILSRR